MKLRDLINVLDTQYVILANGEQPNVTGYFKIDEIPEEALDEELTSVVPVGTVKKTVFDSNAGDGDYVAALRLEYNGEVPVHEYSHKERPKKKVASHAYKFGPFPLSVGELISSDMFKDIISSDMFKELMEPENLQNILGDPNFMDFMNRMRPQEPQEPDDDDSDDYDEADDYEEL